MYIPTYESGDLAIIIESPGQGNIVKKLIGKYALVLKKLTEEDGIYSSDNFYEVLVEDKFMHLHALDMKIVM